MAEVKRYEADLLYIGTGEYLPSMSADNDGDWVSYSDHDRIVSRLQRARARNLVGRLRAMCTAELWKRDDALATNGQRDVAQARASRLFRRADRIACDWLKFIDAIDDAEVPEKEAK